MVSHYTESNLQLGQINCVERQACELNCRQCKGQFVGGIGFDHGKPLTIPTATTIELVTSSLATAALVFSDTDITDIYPQVCKIYVKIYAK